MLMGTLATNGQEMTLDDFQWKNRIILLHQQDLNGEKIHEVLVEIQSEEYEERDLIAFIYHQGKMYDTNQEELNFDSAVIQNIIDDNQEDFLYLIGKDGGVKLTQALPVKQKDIFALIDGMPMRRAEMKRSSSN